MKPLKSLIASVLIFASQVNAQPHMINTDFLQFYNLGAKIIEINHVMPLCDPIQCDPGHSIVTIRYQIDCDQHLANIAVDIDPAKKEAYLSVLAWRAVDPMQPKCLSTWEQETSIALDKLLPANLDAGDYQVINLKSVQILETL